MLISSPPIIVPKTSLINMPLLVALLITSVLHFLVISGISIVFPKVSQQKNTVAVTLIKIKPVAKFPAEKVQKPVETDKKVAKIPTVKPTHHAKVKSNSQSKKQQTVLPPLPKNAHSKISKKNKATTPKIGAKRPIKPIIAEHSVAPDMFVAPAIVEPTPDLNTDTHPDTPPVSKPAEMEKVDVTPEIAQPDISDKPVAVPVKSGKKAKKKPAKKTPHHKVSNSDNSQPILSMDDLAAQIAQVGEKFGNQASSASESRIKSLNSVREHKAAARQYKQDWRAKIERIANLNFPEAARQKDFSARLVLEVGINADGSIHSLKIKKSSGTPPLDEAAKNIVQMAAPFAALPKDLAEELDVLVIQQPMQFSDESGVSVQ